MADYSVPPDQMLAAATAPEHGYIGLHIEQGVPILDRDLNLLHDLITATVRSIAARFIGDGTHTDASGFLVSALPAGQNSQDFQITADGGHFPGSCMVGGIQVSLPAAITYSSQHAGDLTAPADDRTDVVYLDVTVVEVDSVGDTDLRNEHDVGMQTSVRLKPVWVVRVAEGATVPPAAAGHARCALALLKRKKGKATVEADMIKDQRRTRLTVADIERRLSVVEQALLLPAFTGTEFTPRSGAKGDPVHITGSSLDFSPKVLFGDQPATLSSQSATDIVAAVPSTITVPVGGVTKVRITVTTGHGSITSVNEFSVTE
ncbi:IPT/TIG domain-containing protein [Streptomyces sp. NPDC002685]|uniref:IPT/TIG domain-containing protein n=1 Tax=Streptomyces sp. NPDC002685 TaxID=3154540 RepID=UPI0033265575